MVDIKSVTGCIIPKNQRLKGSNNWNTWLTTLYIYFKLLDLYQYFDSNIIQKPTITEEQKTQALLLIRQNC